MTSILESRISRAWLLLTIVLAVHVFEEAIFGFLPLYNDLVLSLRESLGYFPAPTFSFQVWLGGLIVLIIICFSIVSFIGKARGIFRIAITVFGVIMVVNGFGHILWSVYLGRIIPGFWSSFILIPSSVYLIYSLYSRVRT